MRLLLRRAVALFVIATAAVVAFAAFTIGAAVAAGAEFKEPIGMACVDPWVEAHPGDFEPTVHGRWSWWPPGITCTHASGEVFLTPSASDAVAVTALGLAILASCLGAALAVAVPLWRKPAG